MKPANPKISSLLILVLLGFTVQWVEMGPLTVAQLAMLTGAASLIARRGFSFKPGVDLDIFAVYFSFIATLVLGLFWSERPVAGMREIINLIFYSSSAMLFLAWLRSLPERLVLHTLAASARIVVPGFALLYLVSAIIAGVNIPQVVLQAVSTGNPNFLQYQLFAVVFNFGDPSSGSLSSAARHGVFLSLVSVSFTSIMLRKLAPTTSIWWSLGAIGFTILSLSRSVLFGIALASILVLVRHFRVGSGLRRGPTVAFLCFSFALIFAGVGPVAGVRSLVQDKFLVDVVNNPRVAELPQVLRLLNESPLLGRGTGTPLLLDELLAEYPHNFVLYGWHQAGILGLLTSVAFLWLLVANVITGLRLAVQFRGDSPLSSNRHLLSAMLLCLVVARLFFAKAGLLAIPEWVAISLAIYIRGANSHQELAPDNTGTVQPPIRHGRQQRQQTIYSIASKPDGGSIR